MIDDRLYCSVCATPKMMTEQGAILCPNGCGRVLSNTGLTPGRVRNAARDRERWDWAQQFPPVTRINRTSFYIFKDGMQVFVRKYYRSPLQWLHPAIEIDGKIIARHPNGRVYYFEPLKHQQIRQAAVSRAQPAVAT